MRVIDITVKTEETQRLRIMFVLYCSTCIQNQTTSTIPSVNRSTNLATGRHFHPGIKDMRTAVQKVPKVCLAVASSAWIDEGCQFRCTISEILWHRQMGPLPEETAKSPPAHATVISVTGQAHRPLSEGRLVWTFRSRTPSRGDSCVPGPRTSRRSAYARARPSWM